MGTELLSGRDTTDMSTAVCTRIVLALVTLVSLAQASRAEIAPQRMSDLLTQATVIVVGECVGVDSTVTREGSWERTTWRHRVRVERVEKAKPEGISAGDELTFTSWNTAWVGQGNPPPYGSGHSGLPAKGERRRVFASGSAPAFDVLLPNGWQRVGPRVAFVAADDEYRSEVSMPLIAECLARDVAAITSVAFSTDPTTGKPEIDNREHIADLGPLAECDVGVFYMRWREPNEGTLGQLRTFFGSGKPIVGLRTSTHMLRAKPGQSDTSMNDDWPIRIFGQKWISHHGHESRTRILAPNTASSEATSSHPILRGIRGNIEVPSWLYDVEPLPPDCTVLLWGEVIRPTAAENADQAAKPVRQPIVWIRERGPATPTPFPSGGTAAKRMAFTTLGHPGDFEQPEVRRLVEQMILWAAGDEAAIPPEGVRAALASPYSAPPTR
jgi:uncharacterized protein